MRKCIAKTPWFGNLGPDEVSILYTIISSSPRRVREESVQNRDGTLLFFTVQLLIVSPKLQQSGAYYLVKTADMSQK